MKIIKNSNFNKYQTPPNFKLAQLHGQSCKIYKKKSTFIGQNFQDQSIICPCCNRKKGTQRMSLCAQIDHHNQMGQQIPLFFKFINYLALLILLMILVKSGEFLFFCQNCTNLSYKLSVAHYSFQIPLGFVNRQYFVQMLQVIIYSFIILLIKVFLKISKYKSKKLSNGPQKKSLQLINVNKLATKNDILHMFHGFLVRQVTLTYRVNYIHQIMKDITQKQHKIIQLKNNINQECSENLNKSIRKNKIMIMQLNRLKNKLKQIKLSMIQRDNQTSIAYVQLQTVHEKKRAFYYFRCSFFMKMFYKLFPSCSKSCIRKQHVTVEEAPAPDDIYWQNLQNPYLRTKFIRFSSFLVCLVILIFGMVSQVFFFSNPDYLYAGNQYITIGVIFFINLFTINILEWTTQFLEKHKTITAVKLSLIRKLTFFMFFNISITPLLIFIYHKRFVEDPEKRKTLEDIGFQILLIGISNFFKPFLTILSFQRIWRWFIRTKEQKKGKKSVLNQIQANKLFEPLQFPIQIYYSLAHTSFMMIFFYLGFFPILVLIELPALLFLYFIAKWMLLRVCKRSTSLTMKLSNLAQSLLRLYVPLYFLGKNFILMLTQIDYQSSMNWQTILKYLVTSNIYLSISLIIASFMLFSELFVKLILLLIGKITNSKRFAKDQNEKLLEQDVDTQSRNYRQANIYKNQLGERAEQMFQRLQRDQTFRG